MSGMDRAVGGGAGTVPASEIVAQFPATPNQHKLWREIGLERIGTALNAAFRRRLEGRISDKAVANALRALMDRHEILRTRFRMRDDGRLVQEVLRKVAFKPDLVDLRHLPSPQREEELERLGAAEARKPFAFSGGVSAVPLFRVLLVRLAQDLAYVHFTFHNLVVDGWSVDLLEEEFGKLAAATDAGATADLGPVDMQFGDYALWLNDLLAGPALDGEREYWQRKLSGLPRFDVAPDRPGPRHDADGKIRSILLPRELSDAFEALARAKNHTMFSFAAAAAAAALHLITGEGEVVLGTQMARRDEPDAENIVGPLLNSAVLRLPVERGDSFLSFADRVRGVTREAMQNQVLPFAEVMRLTGDEGSAERSPLYRVNLVIQRTHIKTAQTADRDFGPFRMGSAPSHSSGALWDLSLFMVGREEGWRLSCEGATALYATETIDSLLAVWRKVIEGAVACPQAMLAEVAALEPHERRPSQRVQHSGTADVAMPFCNPRIEALKDRVLALQPKGAGVPIIAINNASVLYPVARAIGKDHPFYDIAFCPSPVRVALPQRHFRDHARDAVEMIRLARPRGPYVLFGLCVMGAIAIEAARILQSEGEEVPLVILNDTYRPGFREHMSFLDRRIRKWQVRWRTSKALHERVKSGELTLAQWIDNYRILRALRVTKLLSRLGLAAPGAVQDAMQDHNRWFPEEVLLPSQAAFEFEPYAGRMILFRNREMKQGRLFPRDFGWGGHLQGDFDIVEVPGTHDTLFRDEGAEVIGATVRDILRSLDR